MGMNAFIFGVIICMASSALIPKYLKGSLDSQWPIRPMPGVAGDSDPLMAELTYKAIYGKLFVPSCAQSEWATREQDCFYPVNKWASEHCPLRCISLQKRPDKQILSWEARIGKGVYLLYGPKSPSSDNLNIEEPEWPILYLNLLWRHVDEYDGTCNPLWALRRLLNHLHEMPDNPIRAVYLRPMDVSLSHDCSYLKQALPMIIPKGTSPRERLVGVYDRALGAVKTQMMDNNGKPYYRIGWWDPPHVETNAKKQFQWPDLLQNADKSPII